MATEITAESEDRNRKRKRGGEQGLRAAWRTANLHRVYSSKLVAALRRVRPTTSPQQPRSRLVREAADRVLAAAARGRTRWSRAILASKQSSASSLLVKVKKPKISSPPARRHRPQVSKESSSVVERKAKVLGHLVPGCRKVALPTLLEETSDYIAALQMQIRAMSAIAELLSSAAPSSSSQTS